MLKTPGDYLSWDLQGLPRVKLAAEVRFWISQSRLCLRRVHCYYQWEHTNTAICAVLQASTADFVAASITPLDGHVRVAPIEVKIKFQERLGAGETCSGCLTSSSPSQRKKCLGSASELLAEVVSSLGQTVLACFAQSQILLNVDFPWSFCFCSNGEILTHAFHWHYLLPVECFHYLFMIHSLFTANSNFLLKIVVHICR